MLNDFLNSGLIGELKKNNSEGWRQYITHKFVRRLGDGTLPEKSFKHFLMQDYLFLTHFARAYGLLVYKSENMLDVVSACKGLQAIIDEIPLHVSYCENWGVSLSEMQSQVEEKETIAYTRFVIDVGHSGDLLDLSVALLPCVAGYAEIGAWLLENHRHQLDQNPYASWILNYDSESYKNSVIESLDKLNQLAIRYGAKGRMERLNKIFSMATRLEADFWQMGCNVGD